MHSILIVDSLYAALGYAASLLTASAQNVAPVVITALWQGVAIAAVLALCLRFAPRVSAAHRFAAWAIGFAAVVCLPFFSLLIQSTLAQSTATGSGPTAQPLAHPVLQTFQVDSRWAVALIALWIVASALRGAQFAVHFLRLRKLWKSATPVAIGSSVRTLLAAALPAHRSVEICTTSQLERPGVIGFIAPRILIPDWLFARLTPAEIEQVVLHEAEHLRRRDDWINLLQKLALVVFPLNPALAWIERRLCREREMACDEGVVRRTRAPRAYAACLTSLAERGQQRRLELRITRSIARRAEALSLGAWQRRPELARRVHSVLRRKQFLHPLAARTLVAVVGCGLLATSVELARCPQMVAFVAAAKPPSPAIAQLQPDSTLVSYTPVDAHRVHLIQTKYVQNRVAQTNEVLAANRNPSVPVPVSLRHRAAPSAAQTDQEIAALETPGTEPRPVFLKAEMPANDATSGGSSQPAPNQPYVIVLTSWQEVRASIERSKPAADYGTEATTSGDAQAVGKDTQATKGEPVAHYVVTRLILRIEPVNAPGSSNATSPASTATSADAAIAGDGSDSGDSADATDVTRNMHRHHSQYGQQPTAIPIGNGWLVFQL